MSRQFSVFAIAWLVTTAIAVVALVRTFQGSSPGSSGDLVVRSITIEQPEALALSTTAIPGRVVIDPSGISMDPAGRIVIGDNLKMASNPTGALVHLGGKNGSINIAPNGIKRLDTGWSMLFEKADPSVP